MKRVQWWAKTKRRSTYPGIIKSNFSLLKNHWATKQCQCSSWKLKAKSQSHRSDSTDWAVKHGLLRIHNTHGTTWTLWLHGMNVSCRYKVAVANSTQLMRAKLHFTIDMPKANKNIYIYMLIFVLQSLSLLSWALVLANFAATCYCTLFALTLNAFGLAQKLRQG